MTPIDGKIYFWSSVHPFLNFLLFPIYLFLIISFSFLISFITSFFSIPYALFGSLFYKYHLSTNSSGFKTVDTPDSNKEKPTYGIFNFLMSFFKYKISFLMVLISFAILNNTNKHLSNVYTAGAVMAIIILAFTGIYNYVPDIDDTSQISKIIKKFK